MASGPEKTTYWERVAHFFRVTNPKYAFTDEEGVKQARALVARADDVRRATGALPPDLTEDAVTDAKTRLMAVTHSDTGEMIPFPARMCTFMIMNVPITAGMLLSPPGTAQLFWQWMNQTYNAGFNYYNRSISAEEVAARAAGGASTLDAAALAPLAASYAVASGTAVGMAFSLGRVVTRMQERMAASVPAGMAAAPPSMRVKLITRALPWFAVASAGVANVLAMRYKDATEGITVYNSLGQAMGTSIAAGQFALMQIALTRVCLPVPILLLPPFLLDGLRAVPAVATATKGRAGSLLLELGVISVCLQLALPFAVALFPQTGAVAASALEQPFKDAAKKGDFDTYYFNKGV